MQSIGDILRETRHAKQISLGDAARATKVKVDILEKLESDGYAALPGVTYTKGFLKIYAEHLWFRLPLINKSFNLGYSAQDL